MDRRFIELAVEKYSRMLFRICFAILSNKEDAEDAVQDTFIKYYTEAPTFGSSEHEKAWLIRVATNISKNMSRFRARHRALSMDEVAEIGVDNRDFGVFESIMSLPAKYKIVMDLHYIEGYTASEISMITGVRADAVRKRLQTGRNKLKTELERSDGE
ncbi:MAG: RNA polymerase sigma factor [Clostridia bacterium]|nr:RNA polymerase sigma factor [Clostridia bacterium]MBR0120491.1 RNA polymerase sigma factor [Clostridia bacterium]